jgi:hypothetical protein
VALWVGFLEWLDELEDARSFQSLQIEDAGGLRRGPECREPGGGEGGGDCAGEGKGGGGEDGDAPVERRWQVLVELVGVVEGGPGGAEGGEVLGLEIAQGFLVDVGHENAHVGAVVGG